MNSTKQEFTKGRNVYPGSMLMISHSSMFTAQSGPINISLVALSAQAAAVLAMIIDNH